MTFPVVESVTETSFSSATTDHLCNLPVTVGAGNLLLLIFSNDGLTAQTTPSGWTELDDQTQGNQVRGGIYAKDADGTEGGTQVDVVTAIAEAGTAQIYRVSGWGGTLATDVDISTVAAGTSTAPNSGSVTAGWGSDDNLFISIACTGDDDESVTAIPTNYTNEIDTSSGAGSNNSGNCHSARRELAAASDDPDAFTITGTDNWVAWTVVIKPAGAPLSTVTDVFEVTWSLAPTWLATEVPDPSDGDIVAAMSGFSFGFVGAYTAPPVPVVPGTPIVNLSATTLVPTNTEICDRTGFKQYPGEMYVEYYGHAVRKKSFESRHPQEIANVRGEDKQRGSVSPEPDDVFVGTVSADDL